MLTMKSIKNRHRYVPFTLVVWKLAQYWHPMASSESLDLLHQTMHTVTHGSIAVAIRMASKVGVFFHPCFVCCCPGGCWGNTEQAVARWQRPEAFGIALNMLHWATCFVLHQHTVMAIKIAGRLGALFPIVDCVSTWMELMNHVMVH